MVAASNLFLFISFNKKNVFYKFREFNKQVQNYEMFL